MQRVEVDGRAAYVLTQLIGTVAMGDRVVVNTTAVELGLGTGGGDREGVNVTHALELATDCDAGVVGMGRGSLGTDTEFRFSGVEVAGVLEAGATREHVPIAALRWSDADQRPRHRGLSHHSHTALQT